MRPPRIDFEGARHHVMNRGARRAPIFVDDPSRDLFLEVLSELPKRFGIRVHAYALMPNHYHLLLESERGQLSRGMRHLGGQYTKKLNRMHRWDGPVFRGRFHNRLVHNDAYWQHLLLYVHQNPIQAGLTPEQAAWTSHHAYVGKADCPPWLTTAEFTQIYGTVDAYQDAFDGVLQGEVAPPPSFDPDLLWVPNEAGTTVPRVSIHYTIAQGFDDLSAVTGLTHEELLEVPKGRNPNKANWLAAWWWSQRGIDHGEIKRAMLTTHNSVSKKIRRVLERQTSDPQLAEWIEALYRLQQEHKRVSRRT